MLKINDNISYKYNGILYMVRHFDISAQYIGSGKTLDEAIEKAQASRLQIVQRRETKV
jgi:hypothetical protein